MPQAASAKVPDSVVSDPKHYKIEFENSKVRVVRITYGPGEKSVMHSHPAGTVVFLTDQRVRFTFPDGTTKEIQGKAGQAVWMDATTHQPENLNGQPLELIYVEAK